MIRVQLLSELEEIIEYKKNADRPDRLAVMKKTWSKRSAVSNAFENSDISSVVCKVVSVILMSGNEFFSFEALC